MKEIKLTLSKSRVDMFRLAIEIIIQGGLDIWLSGGQTEARIYLKESGRDIVLKIDGTWSIE